MKQFLNTVRMALYMVAIPLTITAAASAHQWLGSAAPVAKSKLSHVVELSEDGMVRGRVSTLGESGQEASANAITKLVKDGSIVATSKAGVDGFFSFEGMQPGVYTFTSTNGDSIAAYSIELVVNGTNDQASSVLRVVASQNDEVIRQLVAEAKATMVGTQRAAGKVAGSSHSVRLSLTNSFEGTVNSSSAAKVVLVANGQKVKEGTTDSAGHFALTDVQPGTYSFVASSETGYVVTAVELLKPATVYTSTALQEEAFEVTVAQEVPEDDEYEVVEETTIVEEVPAPGAPMGAPGYGAGGYAPYGGGGGMGGFNLSGVGDLIGLGIGAWVLTEVIDEIGDDNNVPTPVPVPNPPAPISGYTYVYL